MNKLVEGEIYILSKFKVKDFLGDEIYRPLRTKQHIYFTPHTKVKKDEEIGLTIEDYAFELYNMDEINRLSNNNRFLVGMSMFLGNW